MYVCASCYQTPGAEVDESTYWKIHIENQETNSDKEHISIKNIIKISKYHAFAVVETLESTIFEFIEMIKNIIHLLCEKYDFRVHWDDKK